MSGLIDIWRHTFPKNLRYCRQCIILHAQLSSVTKRYKYKRYIPRRDMMDVVENYTPLPSTVLRWPVVRSLLFVRFVNGFRVWQGKTCWLTSKPVEFEHARLAQWMKVNSTHQYIERERFEREVLAEFHVATMYHRMFMWGFTAVGILSVLLIACTIPEHCVYAFQHLWQGKSRSEMIDYYKKVVEEHAVAEFTEAYKDKLPAPCVLNAKDGYYYLQLVELEAPDKKKSVLFLPFPLVGHEETFDLLGSIMQQCDGVLLEGVHLEYLPLLPAVFYFPLKDPYFAALDLHIRYTAIVHKKKEPPKLYPGSKKMSRREYWTTALIPMAYRYFYAPFYAMDRGYARIGWGRLKEALSDPATSTIAVPWNIHQVSNLEASLLRQGWKVKLGPKIRWIRPEDPGTAFCDYFNIPADDAATDSDVAAEGINTAAAA